MSKVQNQQMMERRFKLIKVDPQHVLMLFNQVPAEILQLPHVTIPGDAVIYGVWHDIRFDCFFVGIASMDYKPIEVGTEVPCENDSMMIYQHLYELVKEKEVRHSITRTYKNLVRAYHSEDKNEIKKYRAELASLGVKL